jgi:hypothetical protein
MLLGICPWVLQCFNPIAHNWAALHHLNLKVISSFSDVFAPIFRPLSSYLPIETWVMSLPSSLFLDPTVFQPRSFHWHAPFFTSLLKITSKTSTFIKNGPFMVLDIWWLCICTGGGRSSRVGVQIVCVNLFYLSLEWIEKVFLHPFTMTLPFYRSLWTLTNKDKIILRPYIITLLFYDERFDGDDQ